MQQRKKMNLSFADKNKAIAFMEQVYKKIKSSDIVLNLKNNNVEVRIFDIENKKKIMNTISKIKRELN